VGWGEAVVEAWLAREEGCRAALVAGDGLCKRR
jgi:hypothetical protein